MNNLLFYTILIALLYYFFYYLPKQKKLSPKQPPTQPFPTVNTQKTQTEPETIKKNEEPGDILNGPRAVNFPGAQFVKKEEELEQEVDNLLKEIKEFEKDLEI